MIRRLTNCYSRIPLLCLALLGATQGVAATATAPAARSPAAVTVAALPSGVLGRVGDVPITVAEYQAAFDTASRGKFYHGNPPPAEIAKLQRDVADQMVDRILLLNEAKRRGLKPDAAEINKTVQGYEQRYAGSAQWDKNRAQALPPLIARLERDNLLSQIETTMRASAKVSEKQVRDYYAANQDKFSEPEQSRVSVILIKVDPSATSATWAKADDQAQALAKRIRAGEDFAALARQYSNDGSAPQGGDMGYLHAGMLPEGTQAEVAKLKTGELSGSLRLLEGFAIFRLTDRKATKLHGFEAVKVRAQELAQRDQANEVWKVFLADLKAKTLVQMDQSRFLPLAQ